MDTYLVVVRHVFVNGPVETHEVKVEATNTCTAILKGMSQYGVQRYSDRQECPHSISVYARQIPSSGGKEQPM